MNMQVSNPPADLEDLEDSFKAEGDEATEYNMRELMDQIYQERDLIITVPIDQVPILKQGLIVRKAKDNQKLKDAGLAGGNDVLSFLVTTSKVENHSDVRVKLGPKKSVTVLEIRKPNDEF